MVCCKSETGCFMVEVWITVMMYGLIAGCPDSRVTTAVILHTVSKYLIQFFLFWLTQLYKTTCNAHLEIVFINIMWLWIT